MAQLATIVVEKKPLDGFTSYCIWCYTITVPEGLREGDEWALDFPPDTDIVDPKDAKKMKGAPPYKLDEESGRKITSDMDGTTELEICFVATCEERSRTDVSLERRKRRDVNGHFVMDPWEMVPWEDAPEGVGPIMGPGAVVSRPPGPEDEVTLLAEFEARKLAALLGVTLREPPRYLQPVRTSPLFVSSLPSWKPEEEVERKSQRSRRRGAKG